MQKKLDKHARGFVDNIVKLVKTEGKSSFAKAKARSMLVKVSREDKINNTAVVDSAANLNFEDKKKIEQYVNNLAERPISFEYKVKPSLIGGFRITLGDLIIDSSLKNELNQMMQNLI